MENTIHKTIHKNQFRFILLSILLLFSAVSFAQQPRPSPPSSQPSSQQPDNLGSFLDRTIRDLEDQSRAFVETTAPITAPITSTLPAARNTIWSAFGSSSCGDNWYGQRNATLFSVWLGPTILIFLLVGISLALLYMVAQILSHPALIAIIKDEAFNSFLTLLRVGFILAMLVGLDSLFGIRASYAVNDPIYSNIYNRHMIDAAMAFSRLMFSDMVTHYSMLLIFNNIIHTIYSSTLWFGVSWRAMFTFNLGPVLRPFIDLLSTALQFLSVGMSEWLLHIITLCLIKRWMWPLFIPLGVLLRAFPYTRSAGEALISISFALAVIYPFMFLFDYEVHKVMQTSLADAKSELRTFIGRSGILSVFGSVLVAMFLMAGVFIPFFLGAALNVGFELVRGAVYYIVIMSLILPVLNIFVTLTAATEMSKFFRADVNFLSFLKII